MSRRYVGGILSAHAERRLRGAGAESLRIMPEAFRDFSHALGGRFVLVEGRHGFSDGVVPRLRYRRRLPLGGGGIAAVMRRHDDGSVLSYGMGQRVADGSRSAADPADGGKRGVNKQNVSRTDAEPP